MALRVLIMKSAFSLFMVALVVQACSSLAAEEIYTTGFESGSLGSEWTISSELPTGRIEVLTTTGEFGGVSGGPNSGDFFLGMDHSESGSGEFQTNMAELAVDLSGFEEVTLDFWWSEWDDEFHVEDGVFISDDGGLNYVLAQQLNGDSFTDLTWNFFSVNISDIAKANDLTLNSDFRIKFQQRDNYFFAGGNDGFLFDDISVSGVASIPEPSSGVASMLILAAFMSRRITRRQLSDK